MGDEVQANIDALLSEDRVFEPSEAFRKRALWSDERVHERAAADPERFWAEQAEHLDWFRKWDGQATIGDGWMPWGQKPMKGVAHDDMLRGAASRPRSGDTRMGQPRFRDGKRPCFWQGGNRGN